MSTQRLRQPSIIKSRGRHKAGRSEEQVHSSHQIRGRRSNYSSPPISFDDSQDYGRGSKSYNSEPNSWTSDKLRNELSSFIHEFTYLTHSSNNAPHNAQVISAQPFDVDSPSTATYVKQKLSPPPKNAQNRPLIGANGPYQVFAAREERNSPFERENRKKEVEWDDSKFGPNNNFQVYNMHTTETDCNDECEPHGRIIKKGKLEYHPKVRVKKSRSRRRRPSRSASRKQRRRFSDFRASISRGRQRARSSRSWQRRGSHPRRRMRSHSSGVKYIPLRYRPLSRKSRSRTREVVIKKQKHVPVVRNVEPLPEPSIITLYPKTGRKYSKDPGLPCKCDACMNKYESLVRLCLNPCLDPCLTPRPRPYIRSRSPYHPRIPFPCGPCGPPVCCNPRPNPCNRTWGCCPTPCATPCSTPCYTPCSPPCSDRCCQPTLTRFFRSSVHFKLGSIDQCLNTGITQYFHSILDKTVGC